MLIDQVGMKGCTLVLSGMAVCALAVPTQAQVVGPSTTQTPYVLPVASGVTTVSVISNGNGTVAGSPTAAFGNPNEVYPKIGGGDYRLVGIPDGLGAREVTMDYVVQELGPDVLSKITTPGLKFMEVYLNHELAPTAGIARDHGSAGAFVSRWIIDSNLQVLGGKDLIQSVMLWDVNTFSYISGTTAFNRFCSADLPEVSAFYHNGLGTQERIFMNGEESSNGRAFATVVTGPNAGKAWELPGLGKFAWENSVASPYAQNLTIVVGLDDSNRLFSSENATTPSELYFYVGNKQATGSEVEKAGLTNGNLYGLRVPSKVNESTVVNGDSFELFNFGDVRNKTAAQLQSDSISNQVTQFRRVEDGAWDPKNPNEFYFVTTDTTTANGGRAKLWRVNFDAITNPTAGGTIDILLDGTEGGEMYDNITAFTSPKTGQTMLVLQEDVGNNARLGKIWLYEVATDVLTELARHDASRFLSGQPNFLTQDEESSGIIPVFDILGEGWFLQVTQAHYNITGELVRGGQVNVMFVPQSIPEPASFAILALGGALLAGRRGFRRA